MAGYQSDNTGLKGFSGWLIWFQIRCYFTIAFMLYQMVEPTIIPVGVVTIAAIIAVLVLFYMRKLFFRTLYVIINGAGVLVFLINLPFANSINIAQMVFSIIIETIVIIALYRSQRVKNTFAPDKAKEKQLAIPVALRDAANPQPYDKGTAQMWTDGYISHQLLAMHLDPYTELASRKTADIDTAVAWMLQRLDKPSADILDLGCGPGLYTERFAQAGHRVTGVDFSRAAIEYASASAMRQALRIEYIHADYLQRTFAGQFDLAVMIYCDFGVLSLAERSILMHNVYKALKPGGLFVFDAYNDTHLSRVRFGQRWEIAEKGFWQPTPYVCLSETQHFPEHRALLDQHTVIGSDGGHRLFRFWNHYFRDDELSAAFRLAGFSGITAHRGIAGGEDITFFCVVK